MTSYFYLDVSLEINKDEHFNVSAFSLKKHILASLQSLFGEFGASIPVDILKYVPSSKRAVLRVNEEHYVKLYSALTLNGLYEGIECAYRVHKTSPVLLGLIADSRGYEH